MGLTGLFSKPPPQFGQTLHRRSSTQGLQKVHSKEHIMASILSAGNNLPQCSQTGLISSIFQILHEIIQLVKREILQMIKTYLLALIRLRDTCVIPR